MGTTKNDILTQEMAKKLLRKSANGKVTLPSNISKLERGCFANTDVQEVILPEGITTIEKNAFAGCINLKKITFPSSLSNIGDSAFQNCTSLAELDLSKTNLKEISTSMCSKCSNLKNVKLPNSIYQIKKDIAEIL